ncbi:MAG: hypothetical protein AAGE52_11480 [Myxococcota bacterium]
MSATERLRGNEELRREGVSLVVDTLLRRKLADYVDVSGLTRIVLSSVREDLVARGLEEHVRPGVARLYARLKTVPVGDLLPEATHSRLTELAAQTPFPRFVWAKDTIDPSLFRKLFAPSLQEWLLQFLGRLPGVGGLAGAFAKRMGGGGVRERLGAITGEFSRSAMGSLREAIASRLASDEGQEVLAEIRRQAFANTLAVPVGAILDDWAPLPWDDLAAIAPEVAAGFVKTQLAEAWIREELEAFLAVEGEKSVEMLAEEAGVLPEVRAYFRVQGEALIETLLADPRFSSWLDQLGIAR